MPLGFIGLGALGAPLAVNLLAAGFPLTVHNRHREREEPLAAAGARRAATPAEAASGAEVLALCLSDDAAVMEVLLGAGTVTTPAASSDPAGIPAGSALAGLAPGSLVIDFSTIAPESSRRVAAALAERGVTYLDAPVTGGTEGARAGTLSVLVGGAAADLERALPVLQTVGSRIAHLGPVGAGQQAKAVNQVLVAGSYAAVAEAMALGQQLGLPMEEVRQALLDGAAGSWALQHRAGAMLRGEFPLGFRLRLHRKDLAIALEAAAASGLALPVTSRVAAMEDTLIAAGFGEEDVSVLARWFAPPGEGGTE
jgi:3-hydroxyisobutyrate dehydrogenase-like beta-hydroxyacid dehydrogenase